MSSLTSAVKTVCICRNSASLSLFGLPYRNTLFVTDASKELSFLRLDLGIIFSFLYDFREYTPYILSMRYFSKKCFSYIRFDAFISVIEWPRIPAFYPKSFKMESSCLVQFVSRIIIFIFSFLLYFLFSNTNMKEFFRKDFHI